jgi:DNA-binding GntR family transcriptional regulator
MTNAMVLAAPTGAASMPAGGTNRLAVYEELRRRIITLELAPGAALSENELATELGFSRTPVREALILLAREALVQIFPKIGTFVARVDPQLVADAQFLREAVELAALDGVLELPDPDVVAQLRENLAQQASAGHDAEAFFRLDEQFHHGLLRLSRHEGSWPAVIAAKGHLDRARRLGLQDRLPGLLVEQHTHVLDALLTHGAVVARPLMQAHLRTVLGDVAQLRSRWPELFVSAVGGPVGRTVAVREPGAGSSAPA